jgi:hypothetical protein
MTKPPRSDPEAPTQRLPKVPKPRIRKPGPLRVLASSFGLFFAITALLASQMRRGADPALGAPKPVATQTTAPKRILVRRVIVTRIVEHRSRAARTRTTTTPAAPAPAPAAPAPAPAPLTTRSS